MSCNKLKRIPNFKYQEPKTLINQRPDCTKCHPKKQARCHKSTLAPRAEHKESKHREAIPPSKWQLIGGRKQVGIGFVDGKIFRKRYGRFRDRYSELIHS